MAAFVSLVTCHHCPVMSSRRGLVYRDSLKVFSRNLKIHQQHTHTSNNNNKQHWKRTRPELPESSALSCSMKHLLLSHLRKLLTLSPAHQRGHLHHP